MGSRGVGWTVLGSGHCWGVMVLAQAGCRLFSRVGRCKNIVSLHPRPSVCEESHPTGTTLLCLVSQSNLSGMAGPTSSAAAASIA
jgi:hypothetical protein